MVATPTAVEDTLTLAVPPVDVSATWAGDTGVPSGNGAEADTVVLRVHTQLVQPVSVQPRTDRASHLSGQATFDLGEESQTGEPLHHDYVDVFAGGDLSCDLIDPLSQRTSRPLLPLAPVLASDDPLDERFDVGAELLPGGECGEGLDAGVYPDDHLAITLGSGLDLEGELHPVEGHDVSLLAFATAVQLPVVTVEPDGDVDGDLVPDAPDLQPAVELGGALRIPEIDDGGGDAHRAARVMRLDRLVRGRPLTQFVALVDLPLAKLLGSRREQFLTLTSGLLPGGRDHVQSLTGRNLAEPSGQPSLGQVHDGLEEFRLGWGCWQFPEVIDEDVDDPPVLLQDTTEGGPLLGGQPLSRAFRGADDLHPLYLVAPLFDVAAEKSCLLLPFYQDFL